MRENERGDDIITVSDIGIFRDFVCVCVREGAKVNVG